MSMNLLIQFCAGNFFYDRAKSSRGKYYCEADDWTGSFTSVIFLWLLAEAICCFPPRSTYTTKQNINRICTQTQLEALCIWRSLVLHRSRGECRPVKKDKMRWEALCGVGIMKLPNPLRTRYTVYDQSQLESGNETIPNCFLPKRLQGKW